MRFGVLKPFSLLVNPIEIRSLPALKVNLPSARADLELLRVSFAIDTLASPIQ